MQKCFSSNALFAANVMGAAFLETFLLWRCLGDDKRVCSTKAWQSSHKGKRLPFLKKLSKMDLGTLLSIGKELSWFSTSAEISPFFRMNLETHFGQSVADVVCKYVPPDGHSSAILSHDLRNRLHPGKLIREEFEFSDSSGAFASFCLLLAFTSMTEQMTSTTAVRATGTPFMGI
jgi:hypothetical protein